MLISRNSCKISLKYYIGICFVLSCIFYLVIPINAQPTGWRDYNPYQRTVFTREFREKINKLNERIKNDFRNIGLYKERLRLHFDLLELNFDNSDREKFADRLEEDLSRIIELEPIGENYQQRGSFLRQRLDHSQPPNKIKEIYPHNLYFDRAISDYLKAIQIASDSKQLISIYTAISDLYALRPQKLVSSPNFTKLRSQINLKPIFDDFDLAIKYSRKALENGANQPYVDVLKENLVTIYMSVADSSVKLKNYQSALKFYEEGQDFIVLKNSHCAYYSGWGNVYLKIDRPDEALEKLNIVTVAEISLCAELLENKGDAYFAKGEFEKTLTDYNKALTLDQNDDLKKNGRLYVKRAKLFLKTNKPEEALADLKTAIEVKYIAACPQVYELQAEAYRKLGDPKLAIISKQTADKQKNQPNCSLD